MRILFYTNRTWVPTRDSFLAGATSKPVPGIIQIEILRLTAAFTRWKVKQKYVHIKVKRPVSVFPVGGGNFLTFPLGMPLAGRDFIQRMRLMRIFITLLMLSGLLWPLDGAAKSSAPFQSEAVVASLITAQDGVGPSAGSLSAGFRVVLADGWKTYWRTPGEVGLPPKLDWSGSVNVKEVTFLWPAPMRFHAFGIENFGYKHEVVFPLNIRLKDPGKPVQLRARVQMLTCSLVCVPQDFELALDLGAGTGIDTAAAGLIGKWLARVPKAAGPAGMTLEAAAMEQGADPAIVLTLRSETPFKGADIFPEVSRVTTFGPPDIRIGDGGRLLWARVPLTTVDTAATRVSVTVTQDSGAVTLAAISFGSVAPAPPFTLATVAPSLLVLAQMIAVALLGGLILNIMPCVLPVLSIKLTSAMKAQSQGNGRVRIGFLMSAAGVVVFMWGLAAATLLARELGLTVGWGLQFQNPVFLAAMTALLVLFAANLFGLFEIALPINWTTKLTQASGQPTMLGDFSTGAFAAVLATPCSAPFLGTAIAFALAGRPVDIFVIFTALGLGLALPYLLVAAFPRSVRFLPRPGRWMLVMKVILGALLALTAIWLLWVLNGVAGRNVVFGVSVVLILAVAILALQLPLRKITLVVRRGLVGVLLVAALAVPLALGTDSAGLAKPGLDTTKIAWIPFRRGDIAKYVSNGRVVFVDVTADWCLTCKANKALVINRGRVAQILNGGKVIPMEADWTRPDKRIAKFLEDNGRYGIPFNAVYGPRAPDGVFLPEVLTQDLVLNALKQAGGEAILQLDPVSAGPDTLNGS